MPESERWPDQLVRLLRARGVEIVQPDYVARTAWTTDELSDAIAVARPKGPYDIVSLAIGVNDHYRGRPVEEFAIEFARVLRRAIGLAGRKASRAIVLSVPDWGETPFAMGRNRAEIARSIDAYNSRAHDCATALGARWVDVTSVSREMRSNPSLVVSDGLHPSGDMYGRWAQLVAPAALSALGR